MFRKATFQTRKLAMAWHSNTFRKIFNLFVVVGLLANLGAAGAAAAPAAAGSTASTVSAPNAPLDAPFTLVSSGVSQYTISAPKLFWFTASAPCPPQKPTTPTDQFTDILSRVAIQGSLARTIYSQQLSSCSGDTRQILSNVVADSNYLYFTTANGLYRLSVDANVGNAPQLMNALVSGYAELAIDNNNIFTLTTDSQGNSTVATVDKTNLQYAWRTGAGKYASDLQVSYAYSFFTKTEDYFVYWLNGGVLTRFNMDTAAVTSLATNVTSYFAEGGKSFFSNFVIINTDLVYLSTGTNVYDYNNYGNSLSGSLYSPGANTLITNLATDDNYLYLVSEYTDPCGQLFCNRTDYLLRHSRGVSTSADILYTNTGALTSPDKHISTAGGYIFWQENGGVLRLPYNAGAILTTNVRVTGLEITQGIQKPDNSVLLIQDKRTFVRLFVQSDGPNVSGVTAVLDGNGGTCGYLGELLPANPIGTNITVPASPQRVNINDSFLFELPWSWTTCGPLTLSATINPYHAPPESNYGDNGWEAGPFTFSASPRLQVQFIDWEYTLFNTIHAAQYVRDILETFSWIRRAYPVNSTPGMSTDSSVGFRPGLWFVWDDSLGAKVQGSDPSCQDLLYTDSQGTHDNRNLCASRYTNQQMVSIRSENGLPDNLFFYGMLADTKDPNTGSWVFPRGQACCGTAVSTGPAGADGPGGFFWYNGDGTYADWYAAHEIGHTLGRSHPVTKGVNASTRACGQSEDDANYPYDYAQIGADDNTEGFDAGDPALGQPMRVYPGTQWFDVMSYCAEQWISDYTYAGMYQYAINHPSLPLGTAPAAALAPQSGDWLSVSGTIFTGTDIASINRIRQIQTSATQPPLVAGGYAIQLFGATNNQLASYAFTADPLDGAPNLLSFTQVVAFVAGTVKVEIVRLADNKVLTSVNVPAHNPVISNVALQGASNPVSGTVTLGWTASDPDGRPLTFDIYYMRSGNPTPTPRILKLNVKGSTTQIDTSTLGGSGVFRVIASDGFNTAQADSPTYIMANKPPAVRIDTPQDGLHIHYGQLVNFSGEANDVQDGSLTGSSLVWSTDTGSLGTGSLVSSTSLQVGANHITLTATDSAALSSHVTITVYVDDDLNLLGPTLTAGPSSFGWTFPAGATTPQSATLNINNAGGGTLNWTAHSSAPWLGLSATSGTAPSSLTVTANPSGVPNGSGLSAFITLIAPGSTTQPTQTLTIPAGMVVGDLMEKPTFFSINLPVVRR